MQINDLKTVEDLLNADWEELRTLKEPQLRKVIHYYAQIANERRSDAIQKLRNSDLPTPLVYRSQKNKNGATNVSWYSYGFDYRRGSDINEMRKKLRLIRQFLSDKTTTFEGWQDTLNKFVRNTEEKANIIISPRKYKQFWNIYLQVQEHDEIRAKLQEDGYGSAELQRELLNIIEENPTKLLWDVDAVISIMRNRLRQSNEELRKILEEELSQIDNEDEDTDDNSFYYNPFE